jgi:DNA polymerase/3'-5' exonuclease PolX
MANKELVLDNFRQLIKQIKIDIDNTRGTEQLKNMYRLKSIDLARKIIEKYPNKIINLKELEQMKGIGAGTIRRIEEIIKTGKLSEIKITKIDESFLKIMEELEESYGIGKKTAYDLFKKYNIKSIDELKNKVDSGDIQVNDIIKKGLKYVGLINTNIPHEKITEIYDFLMDNLFKIQIELFGVVCGSYRREKKTSGDVDFIVTYPKFKKLKTKKDLEKYIELFEKFLLRLKDKGFLIEFLTGAKVETKFMGIFKWKNIIGRIDIRFISYESYYYALLYFTGSKDFNTNMRTVAIARGLKLNEYGLYDSSNKSFKVESEKDIFDLLEMEYVQPYLR